MYIVGRLCELDRYYHASQGSTSLKCSILFWGLKLGYYFLSCKARSPRTAPYFYCSFSYFNSIFQALGQSYKETILQSEYSLLKQLLASQVRINLWSYLQLWAYGTFVFKKCAAEKKDGRMSWNCQYAEFCWLKSYAVNHEVTYRYMFFTKVWVFQWITCQRFIFCCFVFCIYGLFCIDR